MNGHAIEARLYAENPAKKFFPSPGSLDKLVYPPENSSLRIDSGVVEGDEVSIYYDPLLAKIIAHGTNRTTAANTLADALEKISIAGIITNRKFLAKIMRHRAFRDAALDTGFIGRYLDDLV